MTHPIQPSMLLEIFDEPLTIQRWAVRATGSLSAAALISHAIEISQSLGATNDGWFSYTHQEWHQSIGLTRSELDAARAKLRDMGLLFTRRIGMPARIEYRVEHEAVMLTIQAIAKEQFGHLDDRPSSPPPRSKKTLRSSSFPPDMEPWERL